MFLLLYMLILLILCLTTGVTVTRRPKLLTQFLVFLICRVVFSFVYPPYCALESAPVTFIFTQPVRGASGEKKFKSFLSPLLSKVLLKNALVISCKELPYGVSLRLSLDTKQLVILHR